MSLSVPSLRLPKQAFVAVILLAAAALLSADDWPTYRHDNARSGMTQEKLATPLPEAWVYQSPHAPSPAWEPARTEPVEGILELPRVRFDDAFHVVSAGGAIFFGSTADNKVYCLDAATGGTRWTFFTGGPIRLAPTVANGRVLFGSDDGSVYCLAAGDGKVVWQRQVGPGDHRLIGHGKMISLWPIRTGVLVDDGVAYYGAGIFPAEGVYIEAARADNGQVVWRNDTGGEATDSRASPQGYLLTTSTNLFVPQGRSSPTAYDRKDGRRIYEAFFGKTIGGTSAQIAEDTLYSGTEEILGYDAGSRRKIAWFEGRKVLITPETIYTVTDKEMIALKRESYPQDSVLRLGLRDKKRGLIESSTLPKQDKRRLPPVIETERAKLADIEKKLADMSAGDARRAALEKQRTEAQEQLDDDETKLAAAEKKLADIDKQLELLNVQWEKANEDMKKSIAWQLDCACPDALILAGDVLVAGGANQVVAVDAKTGKQLWRAKVNGKARGLAVANGRLFVSTDKGAIHCFAAGAAGAPRVIASKANPSPYRADELSAAYSAAADAIVRASGVRRGFCLVLGCENGRLALELAKRTQLKIIGIEPDATKAAAARKALDAAGLYGARVTVDQGDLERLPYASFFANLVVSDSALLGRLPATPAKEVLRVLKPCGGVLMIGQPAGTRVAALTPAVLRQWTDAGNFGAKVDCTGGAWARFTRGALPGAGSWTHTYGDPANTTCGDDTFIKCPIGLLWFGDPGPLDMVSRHRRAAGPLSFDGILFVESENAVSAYDAYNGLKLWQRKFPSVVRVLVSHDTSNIAADRESIFVITDANQCLRLDAKTGATKYTYTMPEVDNKRRRWAYVSVSNGVLVGSGSRTDITYGKSGPPLPPTAASAPAKTNIVSDLLFALDVNSGTTRWTWAGQAIPQASISVADGHVFFADGGIPTESKKEGPLTKPSAGNPMRKITSLDLNDGSVAWTKDVNLTGALGGKYFSTLGSIVQNGSLVLFGIYTDGHFWKDFFAGQFEQRRIVVLGAKDGSEQWSKNIGYRVRPIVVGDTLHAEPWAFNLKTGAQRTRINPMTGREEPWQFARPGHHCGGPVATANMMAFRSLYLGYYDLTRDSGIMHFGGQRPGCWINFIFANGLLMMPEASSGCMCAFPIQCTTVFAPREENRAWTKYSLSGDIKPVKHLALNLGAPGDRRDDAGTMWIAYPRPAGSITSGLVLKYDATVTMLPQTRTNAYFAQSPDSVRVEGTRSPWLYTFGACGVSAIELPLLDPGDGTGRYTVRLGFAEMDDAKPGERVFNVWLQGKLALNDLDVVQQAGGPRRALVKEFRGVEVTDKLAIEFKPKAKQPTAKQAPILQSVEVIRERMLGLGVSTPSFQLNDAKPSQSAELRLANQTDAAFAGSLRIVTPAGLTVTPAETPLKLAIGERTQIALNAAAVGKLKPAKYPMSIQLIRADGTIEADRKTEVEYLGPRGRLIVQVSEDAHVTKRGASDGSGRALLVDGGAKVMGDEHHAIVYLKFKLDVPGKPVSATLRIWNAGNATSNGGNICLVTGSWTEEGITYTNRPQPGEVLANLGRVESNQTIEVPLKFSPPAKGELSLAIDPFNCDGVNYISREGGKPAELIVEYEK